jgi:hypothetical protein
VTPTKPWSAECPKSGTSPSASSHHTPRRRHPDRTTVRPKTSHQHHAGNPPSTYLASCPPISSPSWNQHVGTDPQLESSARINLVSPSSDNERTNPRCPTRDLRSTPRPRHPVAYLRISPHRAAHSVQPRCEIAHPGPSMHAKRGAPPSCRKARVCKRKNAPGSEEHSADSMCGRGWKGVVVINGSLCFPIHGILRFWCC